MPELFYIPQAPSSNIGKNESNDSSVSPSGSQPNQTPYSNPDSRTQQRIESLEKYVDDLRTNAIRKDTEASLTSLTIRDRITASFGKIGGWLINAGVLSTPKIEIDSNNSHIKSTNYQPGTSGFLISSDKIEAENLIARGVMRGATFAYDVISAIGGQLMVANADVLAQDMSALDNSVIITKGDTTFAVNDMLVMRGVATSGIQEEWLRVTAVSGTRLTVTRDLAGLFSSNANPAWKAGTPVVKQGKSDGASTYSGGWLRLIGEGTNAPYYSVFARTGVAYNAYTEVCRLGNLNGFLSYSSDLYGIAMGDSGAFLSYDPTNGLQLGGTSQTNFYSIDASDNLVTANSSQQNHASTTPAVKMKETVYKELNGTIRVSFSTIIGTPGQQVTAYVCINDAQVGATRNGTTSGSWETWTEDIAVETDDLVQIYAYAPGTSFSIKDFNFSYTKSNKIKANTINL